MCLIYIEGVDRQIETPPSDRGRWQMLQVDMSPPARARLRLFLPRPLKQLPSTSTCQSGATPSLRQAPALHVSRSAIPWSPDARLGSSQMQNACIFIHPPDLIYLHRLFVRPFDSKSESHDENARLRANQTANLRKVVLLCVTLAQTLGGL